MPYDPNNPNQMLFPGDLWPRGGSQDPVENAPFGFGPSFPSSPERPVAYPGDFGYMPAAFTGGSTGGAGRYNPTVPDGEAPFSLSPSLPTPAEQPQSPDSDDSLRANLARIAQASILRGAGARAVRPGGGAIAGIPPGAYDWQTETERAIMRLWNYTRGLVGAIGSGWDDECKEEIRNARRICAKAYGNGWESDHDVGPYSKPDGSDWTVQDCMRGLTSERCGGNPVDKK